MAKSYPSLLIREALSSAWHSVIGLEPAALSAKILSFIAYVAFSYDVRVSILENEPLWEKLRSSFFDIRAAFIVLTVFALVHILVIAPYKLWKSATDYSNELLVRVEEVLSKRPIFDGGVDSIIFGGRMLGNYTKGRVLALTLSITNVGSKDSAVPYHGWRVKIVDEIGTSILAIHVWPKGVRLGLTDGANMEYAPEDAIHKKMEQPLKVGAIATGYIFCIVSEHQFLRLEKGAKIIIEYVDVYKNTYNIEKCITEEYTNSTYIPFAKSVDF